MFSSFNTIVFVLHPDALEYDWAEIKSKGKRNDDGNVQFLVQFLDGSFADVSCEFIRGMHEMVDFMEQNGIDDEEKPPKEWLDEMKRSKHAPEKKLQNTEEKEKEFSIGSRVYAEYVDNEGVRYGKCIFLDFWYTFNVTLQPTYWLPYFHISRLLLGDNCWTT